MSVRWTWASIIGKSGMNSSPRTVFWGQSLFPRRSRNKGAGDRGYQPIERQAEPDGESGWTPFARHAPAELAGHHAIGEIGTEATRSRRRNARRSADFTPIQGEFGIDDRALDQHAAAGL